MSESVPVVWCQLIRHTPAKYTPDSLLGVSLELLCWMKHIKIQKYPLSLMLIQSALISMDKNMLITLPADVNAIAI